MGSHRLREILDIKQIEAQNFGILEGNHRRNGGINGGWAKNVNNNNFFGGIWEEVKAEIQGKRIETTICMWFMSNFSQSFYFLSLILYILIIITFQRYRFLFCFFFFSW